MTSMLDERPMTLAEFYARRVGVPTRKDLARTALGIIFCTAVIVIAWIEVFWRHCGTAFRPLRRRWTRPDF